MDSHIITPVGIEATLAELTRRNAQPDFICNISAEYPSALAPNELLGVPRATEWFDVEQLKANGIRGLYRRAQS
ncbi:MAG TPA: hypothetical protein VK474_09040 [Chthoniobacterales bacterium]|nr:hypothetical protein [Chthoniobacterales bacterium]